MQFSLIRDVTLNQLQAGLSRAALELSLQFLGEFNSMGPSLFFIEIKNTLLGQMSCFW